MQSILNLHGSYGIPLCLSGITNPISLSTEMADHDRRREAMKRQKIHQAIASDHRNHEIRGLEEIITSEGDGDDEDLALIFHDLLYLCLACTAKAA